MVFAGTKKRGGSFYANIPAIDNSSADKIPLKAIKIIYETTDAYVWVPKGCEIFAKCMDERNIKYEIQKHPLGDIMGEETINLITDTIKTGPTIW